jgi:hypothetical protein
MDSIVNPSFPFWHRFGRGKLLVLQILFEHGTPVLRRKISDALQNDSIINLEQSADRETIVSAVRVWLKDLEEGEFCQKPSVGILGLDSLRHCFCRKPKLGVHG